MSFQSKSFLNPCFFLLLFLALSSCKTQNLFEQFPAPTDKIDSSFFKVTNSSQYIIRRSDKISISVWNNDDIGVGSTYGIYNSSEGYGKWLMVDANGEIAIPNLGDVKVEGLTMVAFKSLLRDELSKTIKNPVIDVKILNRDITMMGEVKNPGKLSLERENNTLVDVLGLAGDIEFYGNKSKIQVIRMINNESHVITLDLTKMNNYNACNIQILPGDIVYVPARKNKEWDKRAGATIIPAASAITVLLLILTTFVL
jgi:polysaccharide biosynthesis/export protein